MPVLSDVDDAIEDHSAGAWRALVREASKGGGGDDGGVSQLVDELLEQWREQLAELRLDP